MPIKDKEKEAAYMHKWYTTHQKELAAYRFVHKEEKIAYNHEWNATHKEEVYAYQRKYEAAHKEERAAYRLAHREERAAKMHKWRMEHPEKALAIIHTRRARKTGNGGSFTIEEWIALLEKYDYTCLCCGRDDIKLTVDHVIPISQGGTNDISNVQCLCLSCNSKKQARYADYRWGQ